jgi:8-oxo-dGTP diphosphatase
LFRRSKKSIMKKLRHTMPVAAHLLLRDVNGRVLFMRRANTGYADGQWSIPAGHVEVGETIHAACVREAREEVGVPLDETSIAVVLIQHKHDEDGQERIDVFFEATLPPGQQPKIMEPGHCDQMQWCTLESSPVPLVAYVAAALIAMRTQPGNPLTYFGFPAKG